MNHSYKELMQKRIKIMVVAAVLACVAVTAAFLLRLIVFSDAEQPFNQATIVFVAFIGFELILVIRIALYSRIQKDDAKLEKMEIAEYDERNRHIRQRASRMCVWLMIVILGVSTIIAYFFNTTVSFTLGVVLAVVLLLYAMLKFVYSRAIE